MKDIEEIDIGTVTDISVDANDFKDCLYEISLVDDFREYLRQTMAADVKRYFFASKEQQDMIKGAFQRTKYFYDTLKKISEQKSKEKQT